MNKLTAIQSLQMIEDLLKDIIAASKYEEHNIRRGAGVSEVSLRQIKEDSKIIYHLLDRVTSVNDQTTLVDNILVPHGFKERIFNYEDMLVKMGENTAKSVESGI